MSSSSQVPSPFAFLDRAEGRSLTQIAVTGVGGYLLALSFAFIRGLTTVVELLLLPFTLSIEVGTASARAFFIEPLGLIPIGTAISGFALREFGIAAGPTAVIIVLVMFGIVIAFLALSITSNAFPGLVVDNPIWDFFFGTPEEEVEGED